MVIVWLLVVVVVARILAGPRVAKIMLLALWSIILIVHLIMPLSGLALAVGGDWKVWLTAGAVGVLILGYGRVLGWLRRSSEKRHPEPTPVIPPQDGPLSDAELDRYARHLVLRELGGAGQMRLKKSSVLIVGAGGLGAPVCLYLAAAGVGKITIADDDAVSLSNLQRQVIFRDDDTGRNKADAAADAMLALNPHLQITVISRRITDEDVALIAQHDLVIDGTDSFVWRAAINRACVAAKVPLIAGAIAQWEGQLTLYDPARGGPCMACLFPEPPAPGRALDCAEAGVVGALPGVVGSMMALEAIKEIAVLGPSGSGQGLRNQMVIFDGLWGESRRISTVARSDCSVCGGSYSSISEA